MQARAFVLGSLLCSGGLLGLAGCAPASDRSEAPAPAPDKATVQHATASTLTPLAQKKFGDAITEKSNTTLDALLKDPKQFQTKTVRTEGVVSAVCKAMGCWMEIADTAGQAHIKMAGHKFFVPKDASGHRAVVQGTVVRANEDECSEEAKQQTGAVAKIEIEATGVEFVD
jgi:hypothetical protein